MHRPVARPAVPLLGVAIAVCLSGVAASPALAGATAEKQPSATAKQRSGPTGRLLVTTRTADGLRSSVVAGGDAAARAERTATLEQDPAVVEVVPERRAAVRSLPNDPVLHDQEPLAPNGVTKAWWATQMHLPEAWALANGGKTTIAVIDTGFDAGHPQLSPVIERSYVERAQGSVPGTAKTDEFGHGTHVASLACSAFNDAAGTVGAGGRCKLITIKSDLYDSSVAKAVTRATKLGVDAIVMSFGVDGGVDAPLVLREALKSAADKGVVLVTAASDRPGAEQGYPANILQPTGTGSNIDDGIGLTVTAAIADGRRASFAGYGTQISVAAYGAYANSGGPPGIVGAFPAGNASYERTTDPATGQPVAALAQRTDIRGDRRYAYEAGTSMAAPMVAGVAGLMRSANPQLGSQQIVRLIKQTAQRSGGWNEQIGWGVVDAFAAVDAARRVDLQAPKASFRNRSRTISGGRFRLAWQVSDRAPRPLIASGVRRVEVWRSVDGGRFSRVASTAARSLSVSVPRGKVRFALRGVDKAGNRARLSTKTALTLTRN